jgi:tetratricopeptide (TPR) repeat protein
MHAGMSLLKSSIGTNEHPFKEEAFLYLIYLKNYIENDVEGANQMIKNNRLDVKDNQLFCFMAANLALNNKKAAVTEAILTNRNKSNDYTPFPMLEYEMGDAKLRRLAPDAVQHYLQFMATSKSNFYIKDACMSASFCYYLEGNMILARQYKEKIKSIGKTESDADKLAQKFAENGSFPDKELLKARLMNDGGYNEKSLEILLSKNINSFSRESEKLEFIYRFGRVYDDLKQDDKALEYYKQTIQRGQYATEYFASRAALQAAQIYEQRGQKKEALEYYNKVLDMDDHEYKNSLDQRAKSGINRVSGL